MSNTDWRDKLESALLEAVAALRLAANQADERCGDDEHSVANQDDPFGESSARTIDANIDAARAELDWALHVIRYAKSLVAPECNCAAELLASWHTYDCPMYAPCVSC